MPHESTSNHTGFSLRTFQSNAYCPPVLTLTENVACSLQMGNFSMVKATEPCFSQPAHHGAPSHKENCPKLMCRKKISPFIHITTQQDEREKRCIQKVALTESVDKYKTPYRAILPAKFNFIHNPELMDVLCQLFSYPLQVGGQHDLKLGGGEKRKHTLEKIQYDTALTVLPAIGLNRTASYTIKLK